MTTDVAELWERCSDDAGSQAVWASVVAALASESVESSGGVIRDDIQWTAVKTFTVMLGGGASVFGDLVTKWLLSNRATLVELVVVHSGGELSGCLSLVMFYRGRDSVVS